jgi:hypothetical protein
MFGTPIESIDLSQILSFLGTGIREGFALDFKENFPSNLEKTLAAFANSYGGIILIGVEETATGSAVVPIRGVELNTGLRERVLQKGLEAIYPPVLPEVHVVEFKSDESLSAPDRAVVVVRVAESDDAPHAVEDRTVVYFRNDNISGRFLRKATVGDIEWLTNKRQRSIEEKERLIRKALERTQHLRSKRRNDKSPRLYVREGGMTLYTVPMFPRSPLLDTRSWFDIVQGTRVRTSTVLDHLPTGQLQRVAGGMFFDGEYSYSEFQQQGLILHEFDYWWDYAQTSVSLGARQLFPEVTASLITAVLELSRQLYRQAGYFGVVEFCFAADGLAGSFLSRSGRTWLNGVPKLVESEINISRRFSMGELEEDLVSIGKDCQRDLYWAFGFDARESWLEEEFRFA